MPIGIIADGIAVLGGGLLGGLASRFISEGLKRDLTLVFGAASMAMGISYVVKVNTMPAVVLAVIVGTILGRLAHLRQGIERAATAVQAPLARRLPPNRKNGLTQAEFMERFISAAVLFCASGTGIFGALEAGMSGDNTVLFTKAILDLFTAGIFAASLGFIVCTVCVPQMLIMLLLFFSASWIMPYTTELMRADFTACGGVLMLATGLRIAGIKAFPIAEMLPAMLLAMPISALWQCFVAALA